MEQNAEYTKDGMESICKANESSAAITVSNAELTQQIKEIDKMAQLIRERSVEVSDAMQKINCNTKSNCEAVGHISSATQENCAGMSSLMGFVEHIKDNTEHLNALVQE